MELYGGARDFDFLVGTWRVENERRVARLSGASEWERFEATVDVRPALGGYGQFEEYKTEHWPGFEALSLRIFDPIGRRWSIFAADSFEGWLRPPLTGCFTGKVGLFNGLEHVNGKMTRVKATWTGIDGSAPRWEQALSLDGYTWETSWVMRLHRMAGRRPEAADESKVAAALEALRSAA